MSISHQILIIGGGAAGLATAASLHKRNTSLDIAAPIRRTCLTQMPGDNQEKLADESRQTKRTCVMKTIHALAVGTPETRLLTIQNYLER